MYIAPERISDPTCVDPRSDIFSLGVVAYFLLTGQEPFVAADAIQALAGTMRLDAPPVSKNSPWEIPAALDSLVAQCQEKNVEKRVRSISDLQGLLSKIECKTNWTGKDSAAWWWKYAPEIAQRSHLENLSE